MNNTPSEPGLRNLCQHEDTPNGDLNFHTPRDCHFSHCAISNVMSRDGSHSDVVYGGVESKFILLEAVFPQKRG